MQYANQKRKDRTIQRIPLYYTILAEYTKASGKLLCAPRYEREGKRANRTECQNTSR